MGCSSYLPEGPRRAGGDPAPGNVATTRLPEAGVREHPAPLGALRRQVTPCRCCSRPFVREHPAPLGALRLVGLVVARDDDVGVREHPAPLGALRLLAERVENAECGRQGAPRTARCIKTRRCQTPTRRCHVREHPAPLGALRHTPSTGLSYISRVRDHPLLYDTVLSHSRYGN